MLTTAQTSPDVPLTLRKSDKLKTKQDFDWIKENGKRFHSAFFTILLCPKTECGPVRCGVVCSRRFHKRAVVRNRARRLVWEAFRLLKPEIKPCTILVIPKRGIFPAMRQEVSDQMIQLLTKAGVLDSSRKSI